MGGCVKRSARRPSDGAAVYDRPGAVVNLVVGAAGAGFTRNSVNLSFSEVVGGLLRTSTRPNLNVLLVHLYLLLLLHLHLLLLLHLHLLLVVLLLRGISRTSTRPTLNRSNESVHLYEQFTLKVSHAGLSNLGSSA